jgi:transcription factor SPT20
MATAIATKPAPPPPNHKIRRPPPPVQTPVNGVRSSQSSPSPSFSSKRPAAGLKQTSAAMPTSGPGANMNGGGPRTSNRRRDSQRPGDIAGRQNRNGKVGQQENLDRRLQKRKPEPYGMHIVPDI